MCLSQPERSDNLTIKPEVQPERMPSVAEVEASITPQEMQIAKYHRRSIETDNVGRDDQGNPITVYSNTIMVPEGKHKGKFVTVPGWFDGKTHDDEDKIYDKWKTEIENDKWPVYKDPKEADSRAKFIHIIMDQEANKIPRLKP